MTPRRHKPRAQASESPQPEKTGLEVYPHELRTSDRFPHEAEEWELVGHPSKIVGANDFVATIRRVENPAETREARWRAHARVKVRRARSPWPSRPPAPVDPRRATRAPDRSHALGLRDLADATREELRRDGRAEFSSALEVVMWTLPWTRPIRNA